MRRFLVIFEKTDTGYSAYVPDLPGCVATGETKEETERNIYDAIEFHYDGILAEGLEVPTVESESAIILMK